MSESDKFEHARTHARTHCASAGASRVRSRTPSQCCTLRLTHWHSRAKPETRTCTLTYARTRDARRTPRARTLRLPVAARSRADASPAQVARAELRPLPVARRRARTHNLNPARRAVRGRTSDYWYGPGGAGRRPVLPVTTPVAPLPRTVTRDSAGRAARP